MVAVKLSCESLACNTMEGGREGDLTTPVCVGVVNNHREIATVVMLASSMSDP